MPRLPHPPRRRRPLAVLGLVALGIVLVACAQAPATSGLPEAEATLRPGSVQGQTGQAPIAGPILDTVDVWLDEFGIMLWQPRVPVAGAYRFEATNMGRRPHDLTILRWDGSPGEIPTRSGRALLQGLEILAQSALLQPGETGGVDVNLDRTGRFVIISSTGTDYGDGMATTVSVGSASTLAVPQPTPSPQEDDEVVRVYLVDNALFLSGDQVDGGIVSFLAQNLGPGRHDLVVVRWRGDPQSLPVDEHGEVLLDSLLVVGRVETLDAGAEAVLDVELDDGFGYVVFSSLPGDYAAGMAGQVFAR